MASALKIGSPVDANNRKDIEIFTRDNGSLIFVLKEKVNGAYLPDRVGSAHVNGEGDRSVIVLRTAMRQKDGEGNFLTQPRQKDGKFIGHNGKPVDSEEKAARVYVDKTYPNDDSKIIYAQIGVLFVKNTKKDPAKEGAFVPTEQTQVTAKLYSDDEAIEAERNYLRMTKCEKGSDKHKEFADAIDKLRSEGGTWASFFINDAGKLLKDLGHEVRVQAKPAQNKPKDAGKDNDTPSP